MEVEVKAGAEASEVGGGVLKAAEAEFAGISGGTMCGIFVYLIGVIADHL